MQFYEPIAEKTFYPADPLLPGSDLPALRAKLPFFAYLFLLYGGSHTGVGGAKRSMARPKALVEVPPLGSAWL